MSALGLEYCFESFTRVAGLVADFSQTSKMVSDLTFVPTSKIASTLEKYLYSVARPMPVTSAICDIVTTGAAEIVTSTSASRPARTPAALRDTNAPCAARALLTPFVPSADRPFGAPLRIARGGSTPPGAPFVWPNLSLNPPEKCEECQLVLALLAWPLLS
jgi:hypothetical protein